MSDGAFESLAGMFRDNFMQPVVATGQAFQEEILSDGLDYDPQAFYCKLSASGYLDQTDLSGPYKTLDEAAQALIDMYIEA